MIDSGFQQFSQTLHETLKSNKQQTKQELAGTFLEIAKYLVKDGDAQVNGSTTLAEILAPSIMTDEDPAASPNAALDTRASPFPETTVAEEHQLFCLKPKHTFLLDLVHEWFGIGDYYDGYGGGVHGRNSNKALN
jgi:hypothetical protein